MPFCPYCGAQLEEGQQCTCPGAQAAANPQPQQQPPQQAPYQQPYQQPQQAPYQQPYQQPAQPPRPSTPSPVGVAFKNFGPFLKAYWRDPSGATSASIAQNDVILSTILTVIQVLVALFTGLFLGLRMFGSLLRYGGGGLVGYSVLAGFLGAVIGIFLMVLAVFVVAKICGSPASFKAAYIACSVNTIPVTLLLLLGLILGLIYPTLGIIVLMMILPVYTIPGVAVCRQLVPDTKSCKLWLSYVVAVIIVTIITCLIVYYAGPINYVVSRLL